MSALACATQGCGYSIVVSDDLERRLRETGETFYCPAGHSNYFPRKKRDTKDDEIARLTRRLAHWEDVVNEALDDREEWKRVARTCPFGCGYSSRRRSVNTIAADMVEHVVEYHGAHRPELREVV